MLEVKRELENVLGKYGQTMIEEVNADLKKTLLVSVLVKDVDIVDVVLNNKTLGECLLKNHRIYDDTRWTDYQLFNIQTEYTKEVLTGDDGIQVIFRDGKIDRLYINDYKSAWNEFTIRKKEDEWNRLAFRDFDFNLF